MQDLSVLGRRWNSGATEELRDISVINSLVALTIRKSLSFRNIGHLIVPNVDKVISLFYFAY
jgi:hypothetical protein